mmetsp:Transcript_12476/g.14268  ORF Transcript_12476/g.14268 Transcript_12476/m.14268 type:complete len:84 (-) Transcript_12476:222-473(-)|eukprot:CAMPEP_0194139804 /NCGR_PEP_ID=MMETSP0152-20130528/9404_1 /TAXON_ID=1049557 /ORGANISM="Thalassiothrix antarctica, Strain L6-D1" /LENGTH=83 /DNA_ID=CAMNT_0038837765 /DNA_START=106 /DNA_END=357 /DNA_ORIENTATION=-
MASGFGLGGRVGRCYHHFADFSECLEVEASPYDKEGIAKEMCKIPLSAYYDCLHHQNEVKRNNRIQGQYKENAAAAKAAELNG